MPTIQPRNRDLEKYNVCASVRSKHFATSSFATLSKQHFRDYGLSSTLQLSFDGSVLMSLFHSCTFRDFTKIRRYGKFDHAFGVTSSDLEPLPAVYFSNSPRYALMWATLKDLRYRTLDKPLDSVPKRAVWSDMACDWAGLCQGRLWKQWSGWPMDL